MTDEKNFSKLRRNILIVISFAVLAVIIHERSQRAADEREDFVIIRSAIVYDARTAWARYGRRSHSLHFFFYTNDEQIRTRRGLPRDWFLQVNIGDTILIKQAVHNERRLRFFSFTPTSYGKKRGLEGFEITREEFQMKRIR